jgi:integrase
MLKLVRHAKSDRWYIRGSVKGRRIFESTGTGDKQQALAYLNKRWADVYNEAALGIQPAAKFEDAVMAYLDGGGSPRFLGSLLLRWGGLPLSRLTQTEVDRAASELYPNGSPATRIRHVYGPTRAILRHALKIGLEGAPVRPLSLPKVAKKPVEWADDAYIRKLLPHCGPHLKAFILTLTYTGLRSGELLRLDKAQMKPRDGWLFVPKTKSGEPAMVPLPPEVAGALTECGGVFPWGDVPAASKALRRAAAAAGLPYLRFHALGRHAFAARLLAAGHDIKTVKEAGRWSGIGIVDAHYGHLEQRRVHAAMLGVAGGNLVKSVDGVSGKAQKTGAVGED